MIWKTLAVLAVGFLLAADDAKKDDKDQDEKKLHGSWTVVSMEREGKKAPEEETKDIKITFEAGGKINVKTPNREIKGTFKLAAGKKVKEITMEAEGERGMYGIYKLDGDNLTICAVEGDADSRPTEFSTKEGSKAQLVVLKREKK
jgi:uncharacterized protein (TIGR03067 family)